MKRVIFCVSILMILLSACSASRHTIQTQQIQPVYKIKQSSPVIKPTLDLETEVVLFNYNNGRSIKCVEKIVRLPIRPVLTIEPVPTFAGFMLPKTNYHLVEAVDIVQLDPDMPEWTQERILGLDVKLPEITIEKPRYDKGQFHRLLKRSQHMRNDSYGQGHFGATRDTHAHNGLDIVVNKGDTIYCPIDGIVKRKVYPYSFKEGENNTKWTGCVVRGIGEYSDYELKIFYIKPLKIRKVIRADEPLGIAQSISEKYSAAMLDHIHVEVRKKGKLVDPEKHFNLITF